MNNNRTIDVNDKILVTGANGYIGSVVISNLIDKGFKNIRCFVRPSSNLKKLNEIIKNTSIEIFCGNLVSDEDCRSAVKDVSLIFHLASGMEKSFAGSFHNTVVTTRNLLESIKNAPRFKRFVNVSSFSVYTNHYNKKNTLIDETSDLEDHPVERNEAYCYSKLKQEEIIKQYYKDWNIPYVIVRPGAVYGPGKTGITARVGIDTFGIFMHIGGDNILPLTYVDNCAEAIVLAGLVRGVNCEIFNVIDNDLPTSTNFLKMYKKDKPFTSVRIHYNIFYLFSVLWEKYSHYSKGQLPPAFNRYKCAAYWKGNRYTNAKLKQILGWKPIVTPQNAYNNFFDYLRNSGKNDA
jgi:nucleoside-diphosphate-sugar epimerase